MPKTSKLISLITGDWHLDSQARNKYRHTFVEQTLPEMIKDLHIHRLIILGDLCQDKDRHNAELVNRVVNQISKLSRLCQVIILQGNHDYIDPTNPFFAFLARISDVMWINKPTFIGSELFLPHTRDYQKDWNGVDFQRAIFRGSGFDRIFAHQTFAGANVGPRTLDGIPLSVFPEEVEVISGDIHVPQKIENLRYVGAPYTINFGDNYKPRVLVLRSDKITTLPVPGPQKVIVEIDMSVQPRIMPKLNRGDMVKVRATLGKFENFQGAKKLIVNWAECNGYKLHSVQPIVDSKTRKHIHPDSGLSLVKSDADQVRSYASKIGVSDEVLASGLTFI